MRDNEPDPNEPIKEAIRNAQPYQFPDFTAVNQQLREKARTIGVHTPIQQGPNIVCISCDHRHTLKFIGIDKQFKGVDEKGDWIIEDRKFS